MNANKKERTGGARTRTGVRRVLFASIRVYSRPQSFASSRMLLPAQAGLPCEGWQAGAAKVLKTCQRDRAEAEASLWRRCYCDHTAVTEVEHGGQRRLPQRPMHERRNETCDVVFTSLHPDAGENRQAYAELLSDLAGRGFAFRQLHLNINEGSMRLARLAEDTAAMLACRSVANCATGATCATASRRRSSTMGSQTWQRVRAARLQRSAIGVAVNPSLAHAGQSRCGTGVWSNPAAVPSRLHS